MKNSRMRIAALALVVFACTPGRAQQALKTQQFDTEVIELNRYGFFPRQVSRGRGQGFIYVRNVTTLRNLSFRLLRQTGALEKQHDITAQSNKWHELLDLSPGTYTLTEASHPAWVCTITIR